MSVSARLKRYLLDTWKRHIVSWCPFEIKFTSLIPYLCLPIILGSTDFCSSLSCLFGLSIVHAHLIYVLGVASKAPIIMGNPHHYSSSTAVTYSLAILQWFSGSR